MIRVHTYLVVPWESFPSPVCGKKGLDNILEFNPLIVCKNNSQNMMYILKQTRILPSHTHTSRFLYTQQRRFHLCQLMISIDWRAPPIHSNGLLNISSISCPNKQTNTKTGEKWEPKLGQSGCYKSITSNSVTCIITVSMIGFPGYLMRVNEWQFGEILGWHPLQIQRWLLTERI